MAYHSPRPVRTGARHERGPPRPRSTTAPAPTTALRPAPWRSSASTRGGIGRVRGAAANDYTAGVVCSKVARYAERTHHPDRLTRPLRRTARGTFAPIGWDEALDEVAGAFERATDRYGSQTVWPYYYAGTMGLVQRDGINRLRHAMRYSGQHSTICTTLAWNGFIAGTGRLAGADPREMAKSDLVIIWGTNAASTQVNVMTHALKARRERGAKIVCIDVYRQATAKQADLLVCVRPGTDGALACALMHVLFRDGHADREYLERYTDCPAELESHLATRTPEWASAITGVPAETIETLARMIGTTPPDLLPARLRVLPAAQRGGQHARGPQRPGGVGRVAARGRRSLPQQRRDLPLGPVAHRRARRAGPGHPGARSIADRAGAHRGPARPRRRTAGDRDAHPEHEPDDGRAGAPPGPRGLRAQGPLRLRARAVHDRDGGGRGHRAAGNDVRRARRHLPGRRAPVHHPRSEDHRGPRGMPAEPLRHSRAREAARRRAPGLRDERARDHRPDADPLRLAGARGAGARALVRLPAAVRRGPLPRRVRAPGREVPIRAGVERGAAPGVRTERGGGRDAAPARPLAGHRGGERGHALPARDRPPRGTTSTPRSRRRRPPSAARSGRA